MSSITRTKSYITANTGEGDSINYEVSNEITNEVVSPFHDIPLKTPVDDIFNMVVEIPRWTNAKFEISKAAAWNPIVQDTTSDKKLRYVKNCFPYHGYIHNYGAFPQTWEDPKKKIDGGDIISNDKIDRKADPEKEAGGDNDPLDVLEIGSTVASTGQVKQVKVLGALALLDEGEIDWKIIAIDVKDPLHKELNDIGDVEKYCPGLLKATKEWFRIYKIPDGKPENKFALFGKPQNKRHALKIIEDAHGYWETLFEQRPPPEAISLVSQKSKNEQPPESDTQTEAKAPSSEDFNPKWYFTGSAEEEKKFNFNRYNIYV
ncbi:uncharacterized protein NDAI_0E03900 [Naumovozyma dairenensis CBS 421]|uniref:inorganic diphosphatase n=1 Tax=Naumovozyma dairenensis (strain ATCC 10597 / BCRC 20456 / CBS 421 / NBRC 0211 / NRRL Y-12639) TaxID=1071378 RepID=G0WBT7_NAUDC|nr:hypothetical protein NDAI_0E03900 [Naumovozyma dairenensis CBS 421]CCD25207.1 hypothetical protein NDAI_0E03900 [Naumovozyma dairenensis CBS 421]